MAAHPYLTHVPPQTAQRPVHQASSRRQRERATTPPQRSHVPPTPNPYALTRSLPDAPGIVVLPARARDHAAALARAPNP